MSVAKRKFTIWPAPMKLLVLELVFDPICKFD